MTTKKRVDYSKKESNEIKDWGCLSYIDIVELKDFPQLLVEAIELDLCVLCGSWGKSTSGGSSGLCSDCEENLPEKDRDAFFYVLGRYDVDRDIRISDNKEKELVGEVKGGINGRI